MKLCRADAFLCVHPADNYTPFSCTTIYPLVLHITYFTIYQAVADKFSFSDLYILHIFEVFETGFLHIFEVFNVANLHIFEVF